MYDADESHKRFANFFRGYDSRHLTKRHFCQLPVAKPNSSPAHEQNCFSFTILWPFLSFIMSFTTLNCDLLSFIIPWKGHNVIHNVVHKYKRTFPSRDQSSSRTALLKVVGMNRPLTLLYQQPIRWDFTTGTWSVFVTSKLISRDENGSSSDSPIKPTSSNRSDSDSEVNVKVKEHSRSRYMWSGYMIH